MFPSSKCLSIAEEVIHTPIRSKLQLEKNVVQAALRCYRENGLSFGECQINRCLDLAVLEMMYRGKDTADIAFTYLYLLYYQDLLNCARSEGCDEAMAKDFVHD